MIAKILLDKKREGRALGSAEIRGLVDGYTKGEIPDYQMSAFAMAVCCRGMTARETADLTDAMMRSGACLDWSDLHVPTADKHSTGGVGDKLSLVVQPLAAACGVAVPSLPGRGPGLTGGTADKLETIPGYNAGLSLAAFRKVVADVGVSMTVQTQEICPADKKLYALRDVTGTVASIPLICASILSKKWAEGAGTLVFDVKFGKGAFMKTVEEATELATAMVDASKAAGRKSAALVTDMNAPLGYAVGNINEVAEALEVLRAGTSDGNGSSSVSWLEADFVRLSVELASLMVSLAKDMPLDDARRLCGEKLADGSAYRKFREMAEAHGGDLDAFDRRAKKGAFRFRLQAMRTGYVSAIDAEKVARVALSLGAGRMEAGDSIDPYAGVTLSVKIGDRVGSRTPLATLEKSGSPDGLEKAASDLLAAFEFSPTAPAPGNLIAKRIA